MVERSSLGSRARAWPGALVLVAVISLLLAVDALAQVVDRSTMTGKVICGYQGWHCCPGDGNDSRVGWYHWAKDRTWIGPGNYNTEIWPDTAEYNSSDIFVVPNTTLTQGGTPYLYSASKPGAVDTHFRWMQEYNIDGAFLQRFLTNDPPFLAMRNTVATNVKSAASTYGRVWALEYDITWYPEADLYNKITSDWAWFKSAYDITNDPRYLHHNGKPVVAVWGFGFTDRPGTPQMCIDVINYFKNSGCFVVGGVPWGWRDRTGGSKTDPAWDNAYRSFDCITPWTVGIYSSWSEINSYSSGRAAADLSTCNSLGILYMETSWPRFGWDNMKGTTCGSSHISSRGGQHLWDQIYAYKSIGLTVQFLAMYDEYDESTAIMKMSDNVPTSGCWWTNEGKHPDWWLRLTNYGGKMLRGEIPLSQTIPISDSTSPDNAQIVSDTIPTSMTAGQQRSVSVTVKNTGETCWNSRNFWRLGAVGDSDPFYGGGCRVYMASDSDRVMPNQQYTFTFTLTAPSTPGTYTTDWRMVHELIRWFGGTLTKQVQVTAAPVVISNSTFNSSADGWTISVWRAGTNDYGTMAWQSSGGNPSGCMLSTGIAATDSTGRCTREGGEIKKTISTAGHSGIKVYYDLKVNTLGEANTGAGLGSCTVDHNLIDEQITVFYSTNGGSSWTEAEWVKRVNLLAGYQSYGTRTVDLSGISACNNNANFAVRFRWQFNTGSDTGRLDNIKVGANN